MKTRLSWQELLADASEAELRDMLSWLDGQGAVVEDEDAAIEALREAISIVHPKQK